MATLKHSPYHVAARVKSVPGLDYVSANEGMHLMLENSSAKFAFMVKRDYVMLEERYRCHVSAPITSKIPKFSSMAMVERSPYHRYVQKSDFTNALTNSSSSGISSSLWSSFSTPAASPSSESAGSASSTRPVRIRETSASDWTSSSECLLWLQWPFSLPPRWARRRWDMGHPISSCDRYSL